MGCINSSGVWVGPGGGGTSRLRCQSGSVGLEHLELPFSVPHRCELVSEDARKGACWESRRSGAGVSGRNVWGYSNE